MASLYADVGKTGSDLLSDGFPKVNKAGEPENGFETEVNAKGADGVKFQVVSSTNANGQVTATFKPTVPVVVADTKSDVKFSLDTANKTKIDVASTFGAVPGLKVKVGANDSNVNAGFEFKNDLVASNFKLDYPVRQDDPVFKKPATIDAAAVFLTGNVSLGARVLYELASAGKLPEFETKVAFNNPDYSVVLAGKRDKSSKVNGDVTYHHTLSAARALAVRLSCNPGDGSILSNVGVSFAVSHQVNSETNVKARFETGVSQKSSAAFALDHQVNKNLSIEAGTQFPTSLNQPAVYNLKVVFNQ
eukprot:CAMPEP_0119128134 /NCGR_PEP_ID=MMETSP1310-20130426/6402_1 /TAXON_ID=464262 /ORGANISM="Genus nov. species nov., Strain RCC2339" /LENGTH=303 /DNA_ID=CAMNT_0007118443 /DNA_START=97 /DNA_END=1008 /DNA_ORIENTATION=+